MIWSGVLVLLAGAIATLAGGDVGGLGVRVIGVPAMVIGGLLLIAGIIRLNRRRRPIVAGVRERVYRTGKGKTIAMVTAVIYILSPIDIVPDVFLPVGIVDDATAFTWLLFALGQEVSRKRRGTV